MKNMGLNDFKMNSVTASTLYKEGIMVTEIVDKKTRPTEHIIGEKKTIVIVLNTDVNKTYTDWMAKVLEFCKTPIDHVEIMAFDNTQNITTIQANFNPSQIWLFGIAFHTLGIKSLKTEHYAIANYEQLVCLGLPRIETFFDTQAMTQHKRALMFALKKLFQIA